MLYSYPLLPMDKASHQQQPRGFYYEEARDVPEFSGSDWGDSGLALARKN